MPYLYFQQLRIGSDVVLFSNATSCPRDTAFVEMQADTGIIRYTFDGTEPSPTHGYRLRPDKPPTLFLVDRCGSFACVSESGAEVGLNIQYWAPREHEDNPDYESSSSSISTSSTSSSSTSSSSSSSVSTSSASSVSSSSVSSSSSSSISISTSSSSQSTSSQSSLSSLSSDSSQSSSSVSSTSSISTSSSSLSTSSSSESSISTSSSSFSSISYDSSVLGPGEALLTEDGDFLLMENGLQFQIE